MSFFLYRSNPSGSGWIVGGLICLQSLSTNLLKSDKISKVVASLAEGINVNPLLNSSVSGGDRR